ncbi:hypothetical protein CC1G_05941 [Coprinopsis cinerea okayama7|uniref:Uncharacterized protein n=1 Tax=Coprinopsis cinerea (strain Okayama-7 / 130 / ATCC MYA-4618 / FGSC 9003) TaxID=240176 RepID=A8NAJ0_COPC7|nr:hypothetical protein CC1G_05941 [Coprinopsis cinerea okayama7\|eukprot:XP_001831842.2 hypothetical protein CC1G_05941 [Coprinopsis cinerea okayama7\
MAQTRQNGSERLPPRYIARQLVMPLPLANSSQLHLQAMATAVPPANWDKARYRRRSLSNQLPPKTPVTYTAAPLRPILKNRSPSYHQQPQPVPSQYRTSSYYRHHQKSYSECGHSQPTKSHSVAGDHQTVPLVGVSKIRSQRAAAAAASEQGTVRSAKSVYSCPSAASSVYSQASYTGEVPKEPLPTQRTPEPQQEAVPLSQASSPPPPASSAPVTPSPPPPPAEVPEEPITNPDATTIDSSSVPEPQQQDCIDKDGSGWPPRGWNVYISAMTAQLEQSDIQHQQQQQLQEQAQNAEEPRIEEYIFDQETLTFIHPSSQRKSRPLHEVVDQPESSASTSVGLASSTALPPEPEPAPAVVSTPPPASQNTPTVSDPASFTKQKSTSTVSLSSRKSSISSKLRWSWRKRSKSVSENTPPVPSIPAIATTTASSPAPDSGSTANPNGAADPNAPRSSRRERDRGRESPAGSYELQIDRRLSAAYTRYPAVDGPTGSTSKDSFKVLSRPQPTPVQNPKSHLRAFSEGAIPASDSFASLGASFETQSSQYSTSDSAQIQSSSGSQTHSPSNPPQPSSSSVPQERARNLSQQPSFSSVYSYSHLPGGPPVVLCDPEPERVQPYPRASIDAYERPGSYVYAGSVCSSAGAGGRRYSVDMSAGHQGVGIQNGMNGNGGGEVGGGSESGANGVCGGSRSANGSTGSTGSGSGSGSGTESSNSSILKTPSDMSSLDALPSSKGSGAVSPDANATASPAANPTSSATGTVDSNANTSTLTSATTPASSAKTQPNADPNDPLAHISNHVRKKSVLSGSRMSMSNGVMNENEARRREANGSPVPWKTRMWMGASGSASRSGTGSPGSGSAGSGASARRSGGGGRPRSLKSTYPVASSPLASGPSTSILDADIPPLPSSSKSVPTSPVTSPVHSRTNSTVYSPSSVYSPAQSPPTSALSSPRTSVFSNPGTSMFSSAITRNNASTSTNGTVVGVLANGPSSSSTNVSTMSGSTVIAPNGAYTGGPASGIGYGYDTHTPVYDYGLGAGVASPIGYAGSGSYADSANGSEGVGYDQYGGFDPYSAYGSPSESLSALGSGVLNGPTAIGSGGNTSGSGIGGAGAGKNLKGGSQVKRGPSKLKKKRKAPLVFEFVQPHH